MHRLEASIDVAFEGHGAEHLDLGGFVVLLKRQVGMLPVSPDPPALEASHLAIHLFAGIGRCFFAQLHRCQRLALLLIHALEHLQFDRQAVAVPSGHVAHPPSLHHPVLVDDVFEDLVEGMAHVQGAVGIGRTVVEGEGVSTVLLAQALIDALVFPERLQLRFPLGGIGAHAKPGLQQVERLFVRRTLIFGRATPLGRALLRPALLRHGGAAATGIISPGRCLPAERYPNPRWIALVPVPARAAAGSCRVLRRGRALQRALAQNLAQAFASVVVG